MRSLGRGLAALVALGLLGALFWLWQGGADDLARWAASAQREVQNGMARALRALRAGDPAALTALLSVCFAYGFFHAVGPGHGKILVGGYGVAERVPLLRLSVIAVAGSVMQAVSAIALVAGGIWVLGLARPQLTQIADAWLAPASLIAIALVGGWLAFRGVRRLVRAQPAAAAHHPHDHAHDHSHSGHGDVCDTCGYSHAPDPHAVAHATSLKAAASLVMAIGLRPCTGALFLLILGWGMGLHGAAIAGAFAMALGTASVTLAVAIGAVLFRESMAQALGQSARAARIASLIEIGAGLVVTLLALGLLARLL